MNTPSLFATAEDRAVERAYAVLRGEGTPPATQRQRDLLRIIVDYHRGAARAISVARLCDKLHCTDREVRRDVHELRLLFGVRIGSSFDGHYLITNAAELRETVSQQIKQATTTLRMVRAMCDPHEWAEMEGQLRLEDELQGDNTHVA